MHGVRDWALPICVLVMSLHIMYLFLKKQTEPMPYVCIFPMSIYVSLVYAANYITHKTVYIMYVCIFPMTFCERMIS